MTILKGSISFLLMLLNTLFWALWLFPLSMLKAAIPVSAWRKLATKGLHLIAELWIACNNLNLRLLSGAQFKISGLDQVRNNDWRLVLCNHQSWADILVLQRTLNRRMPLLKFFLKQELIWVPIMGLAWWALDFPFMKRYSKAFLSKHPELAGKDLETTRKACEKFKTTPVSVINFVEGTRFTKEKHAKQGSPYKNLLKAKAAGIAYVLSAMGGQINRILDVTILYPDPEPSLWKLISGQIPEVRVMMRSMPVTKELQGDYFGDENFRASFQSWLNHLWETKDDLIEKSRLESLAH